MSKGNAKKSAADDASQAPAPAETNEWKAKADEYLTGWQRTQADFDNYRRRTETAKAEWLRMAAADTLLRITPILDDFRRAFAHMPPEIEGSSWTEGIRQVEKHLRAVLSAGDLTPIENGGAFDPSLHEAIAYEEHPELPDGTVIDVVEIGWKLGDRVIKPARVRVSKGKH